MNIDKNNLAFRKELAEELNLLKQTLHSTAIEKRSIDTIDRAIKALKDEKNLPRFVDETSPELETITSPFSWGYSIKDFILNIDTASSIQYPKSVKNATLIFSIDVVGVFNISGHDFLDPFKSLEFNIVIDGLSRSSKNHVFSYHLDRNLKGKNPSNEVHPCYHFHYGGRKLKDYTNKNFGNSLILDMPRIIHYPMDFILGIDFIVSNFSPNLWRTLRRDNRYIRLVKQAQKRVMKPYFGALAQHFGFHGKIDGSWEGPNIIPQVMQNG